MQKITHRSRQFPDVLRHIPQPPECLYHEGAALPDLLSRPRVAIVGSRRMSPYGKQVTHELAARLAERGIIIVSGLALGVDAEAHRAALEAGGTAIAVLPGPLDAITPVMHRRLAAQILEAGGALVSEYPPGTVPAKQYFIARNRLMTGLAQAVLITEAAAKSGSLHSADFALDQGRDVLAVPGNITSQLAVGTNNLIKIGATPVTSYADVLHVLGLAETNTKVRHVRGRNDHEQVALDLLAAGLSDGDQLLAGSRLSASDFNRALTMLEIGGKIKPLGANQWTLS